MKIGVLGTGTVGRTIAKKLIELNHDVMIGTRNVTKTLSHTESDAWGNPAFGEWIKDHPDIQLKTFEETGIHGEIIVNAMKGEVSLDVLKNIGERNLNGKILIDIANPLDFSQGMPPSLFVCNTESLGEQIQQAFPETKVVKTLNTMNAFLMVAPSQLAEGDHHAFISGNDSDAKVVVADILKSFGWKHIIDLGDITNARGTEMLLPIWVRLMEALQTPMFNFKIVK